MLAVSRQQALPVLRLIRGGGLMMAEEYPTSLRTILSLFYCSELLDLKANKCPNHVVFYIYIAAVNRTGPRRLSRGPVWSFLPPVCWHGRVYSVKEALGLVPFSFYPKDTNPMCIFLSGQQNQRMARICGQRWILGRVWLNSRGGSHSSVGSMQVVL